MLHLVNRLAIHAIFNDLDACKTANTRLYYRRLLMASMGQLARRLFFDVHPHKNLSEGQFAALLTTTRNPNATRQNT